MLNTCTEPQASWSNLGHQCTGQLRTIDVHQLLLNWLLMVADRFNVSMDDANHFKKVEHSHQICGSARPLRRELTLTSSVGVFRSTRRSWKITQILSQWGKNGVESYEVTSVRIQTLETGTFPIGWFNDVVQILQDLYTYRHTVIPCKHTLYRIFRVRSRTGV